MSQNSNKKENKRKKSFQSKKDANPSGQITIGEVVRVSDDQKQSEKDANTDLKNKPQEKKK